MTSFVTSSTFGFEISPNLRYDYFMQIEIVARLLEINQQFYQSFSVPFSATRQRLQAGVIRIMDEIPPDVRLLDVGCGNGTFSNELLKRGHTGDYVGMDFSSGLLEISRRSSSGPATFIQADISKPGWSTIIPSRFLPFESVLAFAVLHHIPGQSIRKQFLLETRDLLAPGGKFIQSEWQFQNSPRLLERILPWESIGISQNQVEAGDYLLDWRSGGKGIRYVHLFSEEELAGLAGECKFQIIDSFFSDGLGNRLSLYQVWGI